MVVGTLFTKLLKHMPVTDYNMVVNVIFVTFNVVMIILMLKTINENKKSTNRHIEALEDLTKEQIREAKKKKQEKEKINLLTLRKELDVNYALLRGLIENEKVYIEEEKISANKFQTSIYKQSIITDCLADENLINKILSLYQNFNELNHYIYVTIKIDISERINKKSIIHYYNERIISLCKEKKDECKFVIEEIIKRERDNSDLCLQNLK